MQNKKQQQQQNCLAKRLSPRFSGQFYDGGRQQQKAGEKAKWGQWNSLRNGNNRKGQTLQQNKQQKKGNEKQQFKPAPKSHGKNHCAYKADFFRFWMAQGKGKKMGTLLQGACPGVQPGCKEKKTDSFLFPLLKQRCYNCET